MKKPKLCNLWFIWSKSCKICKNVWKTWKKEIATIFWSNYFGVPGTQMLVEIYNKHKLTSWMNDLGDVNCIFSRILVFKMPNLEHSLYYFYENELELVLKRETNSFLQQFSELHRSFVCKLTLQIGNLTSLG